jgi:hypothetical protein
MPCSLTIRPDGTPGRGLDRLPGQPVVEPATPPAVRRDRLPIYILAAVGALWGAAAYQILWGYTSIVVTRAFVDTPLGLFSLFPVRAVLFAIHLVEEQVVHHPFSFAHNHQWIGYVAAATGSLLLVTPFVLGRAATRRYRRRNAGAGRLSRRATVTEANKGRGC